MKRLTEDLKSIAWFLSPWIILFGAAWLFRPSEQQQIKEWEARQYELLMDSTTAERNEVEYDAEQVFR